MVPLAITITQSDSFAKLSRWVTIRIAICSRMASFLRFLKTSISVCASKALVGSSSNNIRGLLNKARAMEIRCASPPLGVQRESSWPTVPT
mmetsp:Transcript_8911/g.17055  ORF Transcript_8911/g.17055 Transcript_8911/m.17055 type:complete len:91 (+) Transcript_8911:123-395(+)